MIALDTNVLVRFLTGDDPVQQAAASAFLDRLTPEEPGFIAREVAVELVWVLDRGYRLPRQRVAAILTELLETRGLLFENAADVAQAVAEYGRGGPEFADRMILAAAQRMQAVPLYTFDDGLSRIRDAAGVPRSDFGE